MHMRRIVSWLGMLCCLMWLAVPLSAQRTGGRFPGQTPGGFNDTVPQGEILIDTFPIFYFRSDRFFQEKAFSDTLLDIAFRQNEPNRKLANEYRHLGINGSAATPLWYRPVRRRGLDVGFHQYDLYHLSLDSIRHYRLEKAFTQTAYYTGGEQANGYFTAKFSRNFANGLNFSLDYRRLAYLGTRTLFPEQNTRNTSLGIGFWIGGLDSRYMAFLSMATNKFEHDNNGGIAVEPEDEENGGFSTPGSAEVFLDNTGTRNQHAAFRYAQYLRIGSLPLAGKKQAPPVDFRRPLIQPDSLRPDSMQKPPDPLPASPPAEAANGNRQQYWIGHSISYYSDRYTFFDNDVSVDSAVYGPFYTDPRGLRNFLRKRSLENHLKILTFRPEKVGYRDPRSSRGLLEVGLQHQVHWLDMEAADSTVQNLFLTGRWDVALGDKIRLESSGHFGLLDQAGDYRLQGNLILDLGDPFTLTGQVVNQLYTPSVIQDRFYVSEVQLWNNNFAKTLETNISATFGIPDWKLRLTGGYHLINNYIYYDEQGLVQQTRTPISIGQLMVENTFRAGKFFLTNQVGFQVASESFIRLPEIHGKHSLYFAGDLFQVLESRIGFDLRYNTAYFSDTYSPVVGNFRLQNTQEVDFYPSVDAFFSLKVTKFRAFVRWFNLTEVLLPDRLYYQTAFYPYPPGSNLRIGIDWRFTE